MVSTRGDTDRHVSWYSTTLAGSGNGTTTVPGDTLRCAPRLPACTAGVVAFEGVALFIGEIDLFQHPYDSCLDGKVLALARLFWGGRRGTGHTPSDVGISRRSRSCSSPRPSRNTS